MSAWEREEQISLLKGLIIIQQIINVMPNPRLAPDWSINFKLQLTCCLKEYNQRQKNAVKAKTGIMLIIYAGISKNHAYNLCRDCLV